MEILNLYKNVRSNKSHDLWHLFTDIKLEINKLEQKLTKL